MARILIPLKNNKKLTNIVVFAVVKTVKPVWYASLHKASNIRYYKGACRSNGFDVVFRRGAGDHIELKYVAFPSKEDQLTFMLKWSNGV